LIFILNHTYETLLKGVEKTIDYFFKCDYKL